MSQQKFWCPGWESNPHSRCREKDFKSFASAGFATRAVRLLNHISIMPRVQAGAICDKVGDSAHMANIHRLPQILLSSFLFLATSAMAQTDQDLVKADPNNWLHYSGSYDSQRHSLLKQIHTGNVQNLAPKWVFHLAGSVKLEAVPLVVNGVMFVSQLNHVDALDARTGRLI